MFENFRNKFYNKLGGFQEAKGAIFEYLINYDLRGFFLNILLLLKTDFIVTDLHIVYKRKFVIIYLYYIFLHDGM